MRTQKRRRKENKTDYLKRLNLLKGNIPRIVFRKTNKYIIAEYVTSKNAQDKVELGVTSRDLINYGWPKEFFGSLKSIPASYLTGFLIGKKIVGKKMSEPVADFGMVINSHKGKMFSFLKGVKDSGVKMKCEEKFFPTEKRIKGENLKKNFSSFFDKIKFKINEVK